MPSENIAKIITDLRERAYVADRHGDRTTSNNGIAMLLRSVACRLEATAKRAYNEIDTAVCAIDAATSADIDDVRKAMDGTIGDYYA